MEPLAPMLGMRITPLERTLGGSVATTVSVPPAITNLKRVGRFTSLKRRALRSQFRVDEPTPGPALKPGFRLAVGSLIAIGLTAVNCATGGSGGGGSNEGVPLRRVVDPPVSVPIAALRTRDGEVLQVGQLQASDWLNGRHEEAEPTWPLPPARREQVSVGFNPGPPPSFIEVRGFSERQIVASVPVGDPIWSYTCGGATSVKCDVNGDEIVLPDVGTEVSRLAAFSSWIATRSFATKNGLHGRFPRELTAAWLFTLESAAADTRPSDR